MRGRGIAAGAVGFVVGGLAGAGLAMVSAPHPTTRAVEEVAAEILPEGVIVEEVVIDDDVARGALSERLGDVEEARPAAVDAGWRRVSVVGDDDGDPYLTGTRGTEVFELEPLTIRLRHRLAPLLVPGVGVGAVTGAIGLAALVVLGRRRPASVP